MNDIEFSLRQAHNAASIYLEERTKDFVAGFAIMLVESFEAGKKLMVCGNGGSLCDAMHVAEEFTGQFRKTRKALPALALADSSHITCVSNDMGFEFVFSRGVEAFGQQGDILLVMSTSGNSANLIEAVKSARAKKMKIVTLLGKGGGKLKGLGDLEFIVEGFSFSDRIQEIHMTLMHIVIEACENRLIYAKELQESL